MLGNGVAKKDVPGLAHVEENGGFYELNYDGRTSFKVFHTEPRKTMRGSIRWMMIGTGLRVTRDETRIVLDIYDTYYGTMVSAMTVEVFVDLLKTACRLWGLELGDVSVIAEFPEPWTPVASMVKTAVATARGQCVPPALAGRD